MPGARGSVVLMYHGVGRPAPGGEEHYTVSAEAFARHAELLARGGRVVAYPELLAGGAGHRSVAMTFDDGDETVFTAAFPALERYGIRGTAFVTTDWIGTRGYMEPEQLRALDAHGWTVGAHGASHRYLSDLSDQELRCELERSRDRLASVLGRAPEHMSLPGGRADRRVVAAVRAAGYGSLATSEVGTNPEQIDPCVVRRVMVLRSWREQDLRRAARGDRAFLARLWTRQAALGAFKRALGNARYDQLRGAAFRAITSLRSTR